WSRSDSALVPSAPYPTIAPRRSWLRPAATTVPAPRSFASCTNIVPNGPVAPSTSTFSPGTSLAPSRSPISALTPTTPTAAALTSSIPSGTGAHADSSTHTYSASDPRTNPPWTANRTRVPGVSVSASTTRPTPSTPGTCGSGEGPTG